LRFFGVEECRPCYWMNHAFQHAGAEAAMQGHGGLRARILTSGMLRTTVAPASREHSRATLVSH